jgi:hypothetical protein
MHTRHAKLNSEVGGGAGSVQCEWWTEQLLVCGQVLFCKLTEDQRKLYRSFLASPDVLRILQGDLRAFFGIDILRKICNHPGDRLAEELLTRPCRVLNGAVVVDLASSIAEPPDYSDANVPLPHMRSGKMVVMAQLLRLWHGEFLRTRC